MRRFLAVLITGFAVFFAAPGVASAAPRTCIAYGVQQAGGTLKLPTADRAAAELLVKSGRWILIHRTCGPVVVWYDQYGNRMNAKGSARAG